MARVVFTEDKDVCASCETLTVAKPEVIKAYFAEKVITGSDSDSSAGSNAVAAKTYTVAKSQGWYRVGVNTGKTKAELLKLNNLEDDYVLQTGDVLITEAAKPASTSNSSGSGKKLTFKKIDQATMATTVYVIVETNNLYKKDITLELRQAGSKVLTEKDAALTVVNQKKAVTSIKADVGELATGKYSNDEDLKNLAVFKIRLDPDDDKQHKNWVDAINKESDKKTRVYLHVDAHTPNELKSTAIGYQGQAAGESKDKSAFLCASGKEFLLDINFALHIYHTGKISKIDLSHMKKVKMIYHDSKDKQHELCECDVLQVDKRADGTQLKNLTKEDPKTKKVTVVKVRNLTLPKDKPEKTVTYSGTGIDAKKSYYYKNGDIYSEGKKYGKSDHRIQYKKAGGKVSLLKMADPLAYSKDGVIAKYTWHETKRRYCGPSEYAAFLGALVELGKSVACGGSSYKDSTAFPSLKHCNGESIDTNYLSSKADQIKFVNAMHKFGFSDQVVSSSRTYKNTRKESKKATLHDSHMHSGVLKAKYK